jgi:DNA-binding transcriptional LysR family regulator
MHRDLLPHLSVVQAVARLASFARAADQLGMSPSAVSHAVRVVEQALDCPLFSRTTRSVSLTDEGQRFLSSIAPALAAIDDAGEQLRAERGKITGTLRLNVPRVAVPIAVTPVLAEMAWRHPQLTVEITTDERLADIVGEGFDAGVRLGEMIAEDMVAVRLTPPFKAIMVAAPSYIEAKGAPSSIADLSRHHCIGYRLLSSGGTYAWELADQGRDVAVAVQGPARVTDSSVARELALAGVGVAYLFEPLVRADIRDGRLRWLLPESAIEEPGLFLYFPRSVSQSPRLRAFIDVARAVLKPERAAPKKSRKP